MILANRRVFGFALIAMFVIGLGFLAANTNAGDGNSKCSSATKAEVKQTSNSGCSTQAKAVGNSGCTSTIKAADYSGCSTQAKAVGNSGCTSTIKAASSGCSAPYGVQASKTADCDPSACKAMEQAGMEMPKNVRVQSVEVPGGVDMIFTGTDLNMVESYLRARLGVCEDAAGASRCGITRGVTSAGGAVILSVRGEYQGCCVTGIMDQASDVQEDSGNEARTSAELVR